jgi:lysophospholipase L1-like esterase
MQRSIVAFRAAVPSHLARVLHSRSARPAGSIAPCYSRPSLPEQHKLARVTTEDNVRKKSGLMSLAIVVASIWGATALLAPTGAAAQAVNPAWITAWATSQQGLGPAKISNATVRMIARVTAPGDSVRVRLDNTFGTAPVTFGKATIGLRVRGPAVAVGLVKPVSFAGKAQVTIAPGATVVSDPVALQVDALQDVAVSLFVSGTDVQPSQHNNAYVTSYLTDSGGGDQTASENGKPFTATTTSMFWLKSIDVSAAGNASTIVAFGDSITDGTCTTLDAHDRWEDALAERFALGKEVAHAVVNEGIGGNTVTGGANLNPPVNSQPGVDRLDRDVLSHAGVTHVILFLGTNDIRRGAPTAQVIGGIKDIITRVKQKGIKIYGVTIIPRDSVVPGIPDTGWNDAKSKIRNEVNEWMRKEAGFDGVLDFDRLVRDKSNPDIINIAYDCSDGVHPSPFGYFLMGKSVDLGLFQGK